MDQTHSTPYENALAYVVSRERFGSKLGLAQIGRLLERLGNPQDKLKCIHVAGPTAKAAQPP